MDLSPKFSLTWFLAGLLLLISFFLLTEAAESDLRNGIDPINRDYSGSLERSDFNEREEKIYREAYSRGRKTGYSLGRYQNSLQQEKIYNASAETVETSGTREFGDYSFFFGDVKGIYSGISWPANDTVKLDLSELETAGELETMCDHEIAHQLFPDFRHPVEKSKMLNDPIYMYSDDMNIKVCDRLARNLTD